MNRKLTRQVTDFLADHPGGSRAILQLAGRDATAAFDPIHPVGTLEENLKPGCLVGMFHGTAPEQTQPVQAQKTDDSPRMDALLNLDEIEQAASKKISQKGWAYYYSAADDKISKRFNTEVYRSIFLRPRVFIDCKECSIQTTLLGQKVGLPIYISPAAMARLGHPAGEAGISEACRSFGAMQMISNNSSMSPEEITKNASPGQIFAWQIYIQKDRSKSAAVLARINQLKSKIKFIVLTLDAPVSGKREDDERNSSLPVGPVADLRRSADGTPDLSQPGGSIGKQLFAGTDPSLTWEPTLEWLSEQTDLPIILKGLQTHEDAYIASLHAPRVKAIIFSNHGGRAADTAPPAVHTLLETRKYCPEVFDRLEVWVDGGIRRGTDVVKALCLGARAVGIGRPALWGLAAGGVEGVQRTLQSTFP